MGEKLRFVLGEVVGEVVGEMMSESGSVGDA